VAADPYLIKGTDVLANKLGLTDKAALAESEAGLTAARIQQLAKSPIQGDFDIKHLQAVHKHIFQDVYAWAGKPRTIRMGKTESVLEGKSVNYPNPNDPFPPNNLQARADYAFGELARDNFLKGLSRDQFVARFAKHTAEIWEVHPFREGNTRTTLTFMRQLAKEAGHEMVGVMSDNPQDVRNALVRAAAVSDYEPLKAMVARSLEPGRELASELKTIKDADPPQYRQLSEVANQAKLAAKIKFADPAQQQHYVEKKVAAAIDTDRNVRSARRLENPARSLDPDRGDYEL